MKQVAVEFHRCSSVVVDFAPIAATFCVSEFSIHEDVIGNFVLCRFVSSLCPEPTACDFSKSRTPTDPCVVDVVMR